MKQKLNDLINQIRTDFPDLVEDENSVQYSYMQTLEGLLKNLEDMDYTLNQLLDIVNP